MKTIIVIAALVALFLTGCASQASFKTPGVDMSAINSVYVDLRERQSSVGPILADHLTAMGYKVTSGYGANQGERVDAVLSFEDTWRWDITMYLLKLSVKVRDGANKLFLASAESYQPSLQRQREATVVDNVLTKIFPDKASSAK